MSSLSPRKSIDSLASGTSTPSLSQYSNQIESPHGPPQKYPLRRGSAASSAASIGGILDSPSHRHGSIAESGQNGMSENCSGLVLWLLTRRSDLYSPSATDCPHRPCSPYRRLFDRVQTSKLPRHSPGYVDEYSPCGGQGLSAVLVAGRVIVRRISASKGGHRGSGTATGPRR